MSKETKEIIGKGKFLRLVKANGYEFVERTKANGVVVIVPVTDDGSLLFIEQYRPPVQSVCIEFPAGLSGDDAEASTEKLETAARRELLEETGYEAARMERVGIAPPTAGLTSEVLTYFHASGLRKVAAGGGVENEEIKMHLIPRREVRRWLKEQSKRASIGGMVYAGLYLIG